MSSIDAQSSPSSLSRLQSALGIQFKDTSLLKQALTHSSFINENLNAGIEDNERMEFLGDALLNLVVAEHLYREFPSLPEGKLTEIRVFLIRQEQLAARAGALKLGDYMILGKGEDSTGGRKKLNNLADTFEALVAAIFLDQGIETARSFVLHTMQGEMDAIRAGKPVLNFKALLQEHTQAEFKLLPSYEIVESSGPDHDRIFVVSVSLGDVVLAIGSGKSKKAAESEAARLAFNKLTQTS